MSFLQSHRNICLWNFKSCNQTEEETLLSSFSYFISTWFNKLYMLPFFELSYSYTPSYMTLNKNASEEVVVTACKNSSISWRLISIAYTYDYWYLHGHCNISTLFICCDKRARNRHASSPCNKWMIKFGILLETLLLCCVVLCYL